nr:IS3 family transposase [uncultured Senegalimassilia sp.]
MTCWNTQRRQVKLKGLTPEEFRNQSLAALFLSRPSKFWGAVHVRSALVVPRGKTYR